MGSPEDDDTKGESGSEVLPNVEQKISAGRVRLLAILDDSSSQEPDKSGMSSAEQYTRLAIRTLVKIIKELHTVGSPNKLDSDSKMNLICSISGSADFIVRAPKNLIEDVVVLLKEIQIIEESAEGDGRDPLYPKIIQKPLVDFISALEEKLQSII